MCAVKSGYVAIFTYVCLRIGVFFERVWLMRSNVLLCRAIARIGEVPQAEGFGKNQRCCFDNLAEKPLRGCGSTPSALTSHFPYITIGMATQRETFADSDLWFRVENRERHSPAAVDE